MIGDLVFYLFAAVIVVSGFCVAFCRNIVHAAFSLLFTLLSVAALFAMLAADFLTVAQILVYVGGVLVLVIFTVMMTRVPSEPGQGPRANVYLPAGIFALAVFALVYRVITISGWGGRTMAPDDPVTADIGVQIMTNYIFPFEYVSLALLVAMVGAAIVIRERKTRLDAASATAGASGDAAVDPEPDPAAGAGSGDDPQEVQS